MNDSEQTQIQQILLNKKMFKAAAKSFSFSELLIAQTNLNTLVESRREAAEAEQKAQAERNEKILEIKIQMEKLGFTADDLAGTPIITKAKKTRPQKPPKYEFLDENNEIKTWTGQGRTPKGILTYINTGGTLEELLIK